MAKNEGERARWLKAEVERKLPEFVNACESETDFVIMHQDAFAAELDSDELVLLGKAIKYAGLVRKEVRIIPSQH
jgi:hypothetical protein